MKKKKYALLVIDMQLVAFDGKITPPIVNGSRLLGKVSMLLDTCRSEKIPIVFLQTCASSGQHYARDVHGWELHPEVSPRPSESIVYKVASSGFENTTLQDTLGELGATELIVCGIWSEYCVTATSESALELGYDVCIAADGHGTVRDSEIEAAEVVASQNDYLSKKNASVVGIQHIKDYLRRN